MNLVEGSLEDQFSLLDDYCLQLILTNPGSSVHLQTTLNEYEVRVFQQVYVCLAICKKGQIEGFRLLVGLDGCFIKGGYSGQLLDAVGLDANNSIFPIAYAVVQTEKYKSYKWFLEHLVNNLQIFNSRYFTFISDRQEGLKLALSQVVPDSEQRSCVRHVYENFKNKFLGLFLKQKVMGCCQSDHC